MYDRETIELALYALEIGHSTREAAEIAGASKSAVCAWASGRIPRERQARASGAPGGRRAGRTRKADAVDESERAAYEAAMTENMLLRAVLDDLKGEGSHPGSMSNRRKCELGERLRAATGLPLREITAFLRISKSSYEYWRPRLGLDKYAGLRVRVAELFAEGRARWGYRVVWARLRAEGVRVSEKVVRRIMREEGLGVVYARRRRRGWSSYEGEVSKAPENLVARDFHADAPDRLWLSDITEFRLPDAPKVYLSPVIDCFDGRPAAWSIGLHPDKELANSSLLGALARRGGGGPTVIHTDRGGHYRWPEWVAICEEHGLVRSMSAKGCSPDNAACEGFFGRLKNEFFYYSDWSGVTAEEFMGRLDAYMRYYCEGRIKESLEWMSPNEYRRSLGYPV